MKNSKKFCYLRKSSIKHIKKHQNKTIDDFGFTAKQSKREILLLFMKNTLVNFFP